MVRQLCLEAPDTLHPVMVRGVEGMAIFHHGPHAGSAPRPATPQTVRRHRVLPPIAGRHHTRRVLGNVTSFRLTPVSMPRGAARRRDRRGGFRLTLGDARE